MVRPLRPPIVKVNAVLPNVFATGVPVYNPPFATANTFGNTAFTFTMGGRNGRTTFETLVAMGSMTGDASDDAIAPDA